MNAPRFLRALLAVVPVFGLAACDRQAGTSDEHETTVAARLFLPDGSPASGARIKIYAVADTSKTPRDQVFTAADGSVSLPTDLPAGEYNLVVSDGDGNGLVIDSLLSKGTGAPQLRSDTLRPMGVIAGRLQVEPQHSPRIAWVQIMGTGLATNVDTSGNFRLEVPAGKVTLAARTLEPQYTPTFRAIRTIPDSVLDIGTLRLEYTGIPVVEGLSVTYDTLNGVATLRWNRATMPGLRGYEVHRSGFASVSLDDLSDTVFHDTLFQPSLFRADAASREYSVVAVDSARIPGLDWRRVALAAPSPWGVKRKGFRFDSLGVLPSQGCGELDTLAGGLLCLYEKPLDGPMQYLYRADTSLVRVSTDGRSWATLPIPSGRMRTVAWKGKIWAIRGIANGRVAKLLNRDGDSIVDPSGNAVQAPLFDGVRIEAWSTSGILEKVDTILDRRDAFLYRLTVVSDTLVLSRDSAYDFPMAVGLGPTGIYPAVIGLRRLGSVDGTWSEEGSGDVPMEIATSFRWFRERFYADNSFSVPEGLLLEWGGREWGTSWHGLISRATGERFPWQSNPEGGILLSPIHRGNGWVVPPFLVWHGCALVQSADGMLLGICHED